MSPRLNDRAAALARSYEEAANGVKIVTSRGDIDFVVSRDLTQAPKIAESIDGQAIWAHTNAEILAKKIEFRGFAFTRRDMFDLAVLIDLEPSSVAQALSVCSKGATTLAISRIAAEIGTLGRTLPDFVDPTPRGAAYIARAAPLLASYFGLDPAGKPTKT